MALHWLTYYCKQLVTEAFLGMYLLECCFVSRLFWTVAPCSDESFFLFPAASCSNTFRGFPGFLCGQTRIRIFFCCHSRWKNPFQELFKHNCKRQPPRGVGNLLLALVCISDFVLYCGSRRDIAQNTVGSFVIQLFAGSFSVSILFEAIQFSSGMWFLIIRRVL